jgi:hypothetical protein
MKTLPLSEVLKLATPGKLDVRSLHICIGGRSIGELHGYSAFNAETSPGMAKVAEQERADAALLAHSMNIRDELIEALEKATHRLDCTCKDDDVVEELEAVLARAKTVVMP